MLNGHQWLATLLAVLYQLDFGDVRYWPLADIASCAAHVCFGGQSGHPTEKVGHTFSGGNASLLVKPYCTAR